MGQKSDMHSLFAIEYEVLDSDGDDAEGNCLAGIRQSAHPTHPSEQPRGMLRRLVLNSSALGFVVHSSPQTVACVHAGAQPSLE